MGLPPAQDAHLFNTPAGRHRASRCAAPDRCKPPPRRGNLKPRGLMQVSSFGPVGTLPQAVRRDFSGVSYDEAMRRAREIVPLMRERARAAEDARVLIRENEQRLHETGLFRMHQAKAFGGMEPPFFGIHHNPAGVRARLSVDRMECR